MFEKKSVIRITSLYMFFILAIFTGDNAAAQKRETGNKGASYYISLTGNDQNRGTKEMPWKSIARLNSVRLKAGDTVFLEGGSTFQGTLRLEKKEAGTSVRPIVIISYGRGKAVIAAESITAISLYQARYIVVCNLAFMGAGRKTGNRESGLSVIECNNIVLDDLDISGFQKSGVSIYQSAHVKMTHVYAHDNGFAGISVEGPYEKKSLTHDIYIGDCKAEDNPGDPTNFTNHSGNGIVAGHCKKVTIAYCTATNNGWDMPRVGNGPVGIWAYEADSVLIQHCISYRNRTSPGSSDGGGFDLDGGVTNSIIQYCLSYENEGAAVGIFQYAGASPWHNNIIRHNISINDGMVSTARAGIFIWNSSRDPQQFRDCSFYNNIIYNEQGAVISYDEESEHDGFRFYNNIFVAGDSLIRGWKWARKGNIFTGNNWWSIKDKFNIDGITDFTAWVLQYHQEQKNGRITGTNRDPQLKNIHQFKSTDPHAKTPFH